MLKAKKKITKKEMKKDPFLESIYHTKEYIEANRSIITKVGGGVFVAILAMILFYNNLQEKKIGSEEALGKAMVSLSIGDRDNGILQLQLLTDDYSGTSAAQQGTFMLAKLFYEDNDLLTAESYLNDFLNDATDEFHAGALAIRSDILKSEDDLVAFESTVKKGIKVAQSEEEKDHFRLKLAALYMETNRYSEAKEIAEPIRETYERRSELYNKADEILGHLHIVFSDEQ